MMSTMTETGWAAPGTVTVSERYRGTVTAGPSTDTRTTHYTSFGSVVGHSAPSRIAQTSIGE